MGRDAASSATGFSAPRNHFEAFAEEGVVVIIWKQRPVMAGVNALAAMFRDQQAKRGTFANLVVVEPQAGHDMDAPIRKELSVQLDRFATNLAGAAIVFTASGFIASIQRSLVIAITAAVRVHYPVKVEQDLPVCTAWLAERLRARGVPCDAHKLLATVQARRAGD